MAAPDSVQLRRNDFTGSGVQRSTTGTVQTTITRIDLPVEQMQISIERGTVANKRNDPDAKLYDPGLTQAVVTIVGTLVGYDTIDAPWLMDDLTYASTKWFKSHGGVIDLYWTQTKVLSGADWNSVDDGYLVWTGGFKSLTFSPKGGELNQIPYTLQFYIGD